MSAGLKRKWRPGIGLIIVSILLTVMALPLVGLFFFRIYENQLVRQTEAELIAEAAAIGAAYARDLRDAGMPPERLGSVVAGNGGRASSDPPLPGRAPPADWPYRPIEPQLDLATDYILGPRPDGEPEAPDPVFTAIGARLAQVITDTQTTTLAGFRLLDPRGVVIAGGDDAGRSFAHVEEVQAALAGRYASVLRQRVAARPVPPVYSVSRGTGVRVFVALPVVIGDRVAGVVYASRTPNNIVKHLYGERGKVLAAALSMLGVALVIAYVAVRTISRPMLALIERTQRIAAGDSGAIAPLKRHGTREMAELSAAFIDMARRLQARSETIRTFASHVSHELKSPLTAIHGAAELLRDTDAEMTAEQRHRFLDNIIGDADRLTRLVRRLLELARAEAPPLSGGTANLAEALQLLPSDGRIAVTLDGGAELRFRMSAENAAIALANFVDNSARHGARRCALSAEAQGNTIRIAAADDGEGISPNNRQRIFEPFFTTRRESGGTGLGLGIVAALVKAHDGSVRLAESASGARFEIDLPAASG
jgi:signal transduction histidine kinase